MMLSPLAIAAASVAVLAGGFLWYSPFIFGNLWLKHCGVSEQAMKKNMPWGMIIGFGAAVMQVTFLSLLLPLLPVHSVGDALKMAVILWACFALPLQLGKVAWEAKSWIAFGINVSYDLAFLLISLSILTSLS